MGTVRTVSAVLVVLGAFTAFQLIANYSLRRAVQRDVRRQIESSDREMARHLADLSKARTLATAAVKSLDTLRAQLAAAAERSGEMAKSAGELETRIKAAVAALDAVQKKLGGVDGAAGEVPALRTSVGRLQDRVEKAEASSKETVGALEAQVRAADAAVAGAAREAARANEELRKLSADLVAQKVAVPAAAFEQMKKDLDAVRAELKKLLSARPPGAVGGGGT